MGIPISISRTYNSRTTADTNFGYGWNNNVGLNLSYTDGKAVQLTDGTGSVYYFIKQLDGTYQPPVGIYYKLYKDGSVYVLEDTSGVKNYFDANGRLDKVVDPQGNTTDVVTDASGLVTTVVDPSGRYAQFNYYSTSPKRLQNIKLNTTPGSYPSSPASETAASYTYNPDGDLETVTKVNDGHNVVITFGYDGHNLTSITDAEGNVTSVGYLGDRVSTISKTLDPATSGVVDESGYGLLDSTTTGLSSVTTSFSYQPRVQPEDFAMVTTVTDPRDDQTIYRSNDQGNVEQVEQVLSSGNELYKMDWDEMQNLFSIQDPKQNSTVMGYDAKGNVLSVRNPDGDSAIYHYNADGDVISSTDFSGRSTIQSYDEKRQLVSSTNQQFATSATIRDDQGNVVEEHIPMTIAENLILNAGLETWSNGEPTDWVNLTPSPGTISDDTVNKVNGEHSVKVVGQTDGGTGYGRIATDVYTPVQAKGRYVVSWSEKTSSVGPDGAGLIVHWYNSSKTWIAWTTVIEPVSGTTDWSSHAVPVNAPANAAYARIEFRLLSPGTGWLDDVQLERGSAINGINVLTNESFEVNQDDDQVMPDGWWSDTLIGTDGVTTAEAHSGNNSVLITASSAYGRNFGLGVDTSDESVAGTAGTAVTFSGWIKTSNLTAPAEARLKVTYLDGSLGWFDAFTTSGTHGFEYVENTVVIPKDFKHWSLYGWMGTGSGQAWFDDLSMHVYGASSITASDFNMFDNGSLELDLDDDNWPDDVNLVKSATPGTYDVSWVSASSTFQAYSGSKAIRFKGLPAWAALENGTREELKDGMGYTGQAMVKTENVTQSGVAMKFAFYHGANKLGEKLTTGVINGTKDWTKLSFSMTTAEIQALYPTADHISFMVGARAATVGTFYLDGVRMTEKATKTAYDYDDSGNYLQRVTNPLGNSVDFTNDAHGNVLTVQDPKGNYASFTYDDLDRLQTAENANNLLTEYGYDDNGNLLTVTQKDGITLQSLGVNTSVYNELGLVTQVIDPMSHITKYRYDQNGNLAYVKTASGQEAWFVYDQQDRLTEVQYLQSGVGQLLVFTYDKNGNRLTAVHKTGSLSNPGSMTVQTQYSYGYTYDALNRVQTIDLPNGKTVGYAYDPVGRVTSISNSDVNTVNYDYDYTGLNTSISDTTAGNVDFIYDELGRVIKASEGTALTVNVEYNAIGQVTSQQTVNAAGSIVTWNHYEYDQNGNREQDTLQDGSYVKYEYDAVNELLFERYYSAQDALTRTEAYTYDKQGNRLTKEVTVGGSTTTTSYSYNAANEMTAIDGVAVTSSDGNQLNTGDNKLVFNTLGQVVQLLSNSGQLLEQYEYNADGLRTAKLNASGVVQEKYFYNGSKLAYVTDKDDNVLYYFTRSSSGALLSMVDCSGATDVAYWYVKDAHGNVVGLTDDAGNSVASYTYDAWGNELSASGSMADANPFRYSSYYFDTASGLYYLNARYYSPKIGRFLSQDPAEGVIGAQLTSSPYVYGLNNPIQWVDNEGTTVQSASLEVSLWAWVGFSISIGFAWDSSGRKAFIGSIGFVNHNVSAGATIGGKYSRIDAWDNVDMLNGTSTSISLAVGLPTPIRPGTVTIGEEVVDPKPFVNHPFTEDGTTMERVRPRVKKQHVRTAEHRARCSI